MRFEPASAPYSHLHPKRGTTSENNTGKPFLRSSAKQPTLGRCPLTGPIQAAVSRATVRRLGHDLAIRQGSAVGATPAYPDGPRRHRRGARRWLTQRTLIRHSRALEARPARAGLAGPFPPSRRLISPRGPRSSAGCAELPHQLVDGGIVRQQPL